MPRYQLKQDYIARYAGGEIGKKTSLPLSQGQFIEAVEFVPPPNKVRFRNLKPSVTFDGYLIPLDKLDLIPAADGTEDIEAKDYVTHEDIEQSGQAYKMGIVLGAVAGVLGSLIFGGSKLIWIIGGAIGGGYIASSMSELKPTESKFQTVDNNN